ncbi:unnamed protein product, partial [Prorocentrum cordatum]
EIFPSSHRQLRPLSDFSPRFARSQPKGPETPSQEEFNLDSTASELDSPPTKRTKITKKTSSQSCSPQCTPMAPVGLDATDVETLPYPKEGENEDEAEVVRMPEVSV